MIHTDCGDFAAIYVEPFVMLNKGIEPTDTNISGVANVHAPRFRFEGKTGHKKEKFSESESALCSDIGIE